MSFGIRVRQRRKELNLSREELAIAADISYSQMSRYEIDENEPTSGAILAIARTLKVSTDWLLENTEEIDTAGLTPVEAEALAVFRNKPTRRQQALLEILKIAE